MDNLDEVARSVRSCTDCPLHRGRTNAVPGEGSPSADLMFIGEGPGFHEDRQGRPFVGPAGQLLEGLLASIGTNREDVFIANMVKCRPPDNRDPQPSEISACAKYLDRQIELVNPKIIVTLGRFSLGRFFPGESITRARGRLRQIDGRLLFPVLHPAAALRRPELRTTLVEDFRSIAAALEDQPPTDAAPLGTAAGAGDEPAPNAGSAVQTDLFGAVSAQGPAVPPGDAHATGQPDAPDHQAESDTSLDPVDPQQLSMF